MTEWTVHRDTTNRTIRSIIVNCYIRTVLLLDDPPSHYDSDLHSMLHLVVPCRAWLGHEPLLASASNTILLETPFNSAIPLTQYETTAMQNIGQSSSSYQRKQPECEKQLTVESTNGLGRLEFQFTCTPSSASSSSHLKRATAAPLSQARLPHSIHQDQSHPTRHATSSVKYSY